MGNFFTIRDVLKKYHGMAMRWFLVNTQYRAPMNYSQQALEDASARLYYLTETLVRSHTMIADSGTQIHYILVLSGSTISDLLGVIFIVQIEEFWQAW